jgi:hypothetical protein
VLRQVSVTRYVTPLREGGSLPGLMEADDLGTYVVKFRGAGQGPKALVAEVIAAGLARALDLPVPDLVLVDLDPALAPAEPDQEVQDLLRASAGTNLGVDFLPGALDFSPSAFPVDPEFAGRVLWFDALIDNRDRTHRNPNMLQWHGTRLIDHGASLPFHHRWETAAASDARAYDASDHVLIGSRPAVVSADAALAPLLTPAVLDAVVDDVPVAWLDGATAADYVDRLRGRLAARDTWVPALAASVAAHEAGAAR